MRKQMVLGKEIDVDVKRRIAGAECWLDDDGMIWKAKKVRETGERADVWRAAVEDVT
jgi:hypothetical protein